MHDVIVLRCT